MSKKKTFEGAERQGSDRVGTVPYQCPTTAVPVPQTGWLNAGVCALVLLGTRSLKSRCRQGRTPSEAPGGRILPLPALVVAGNPWLTDVPAQCLPPCSHGPSSVSSCLCLGNLPRYLEVCVNLSMIE